MLAGEHRPGASCVTPTWCSLCTCIPFVFAVTAAQKEGVVLGVLAVSGTLLGPLGATFCRWSFAGFLFCCSKNLWPKTLALLRLLLQCNTVGGLCFNFKWDFGFLSKTCHRFQLYRGAGKGAGLKGELNYGDRSVTFCPATNSKLIHTMTLERYHSH